MHLPLNYVLPCTQMLLPALRPLWLALAAVLPDAAQKRHMAARQVVADVSRRLMREWQQQSLLVSGCRSAGSAEVKPVVVAVTVRLWYSSSGGLSSQLHDAHVTAEHDAL